MIKPRVYLDTTVPSALLDDRTPLRQESTRVFLEIAADKYRLCTSELTENEILRTPESKRRQALLEFVRPLELLSVTKEADEVATTYIAEGVLPEKYITDARHLAVATIHGVRLVTSWNFRHLVKVATRDRVNFINATLGYSALEIVSPEEL